MKQQYQLKQRQPVVNLEIKGLRQRRTLLPREMCSWSVDFSSMRTIVVSDRFRSSFSLRYATMPMVIMPRPIRV